MKIVKANSLLILAALAAFALPACKAKKAVVKPDNAAVAPKAPEPAPPAPTPPPAPAPEPAPAPAPKPDLNFASIQFEFNSAVLKTGSYEMLDKVARAIKQSPGVSFVLNGNSSAEGSAEHNMSLSVDRANSVKAYLENAGVDGNLLTAKGYGESKPVAPNTTEEGRALNRRVEVKPVQ